MARKKKVALVLELAEKPAAATPIVDPILNAFDDPDGQRICVRLVEGARQLVRVHDNALAWEWSPEAIRQTPLKAFDFVPGSIVRIDTPADAEQAKVDAFREVFVREGAAAVRIGARPKSEVVVRPDGNETKLDGRYGARAAVESLVEAANVDDRPALSALSQDIMTRAGL